MYVLEVTFWWNYVIQAHVYVFWWVLHVTCPVTRRHSHTQSCTSPGVGCFVPNIMVHVLTIHSGLSSPSPGLESFVASVRINTRIPATRVTSFARRNSRGWFSLGMTHSLGRHARKQSINNAATLSTNASNRGKSKWGHYCICIRHYSSVKKNAGLNKSGLFAGPRFDDGQKHVNSNQYGFEHIDLKQGF